MEKEVGADENQGGEREELAVRLLNTWIFNQGILVMNNISFVGHKKKNANQKPVEI